MVEQPERQRDDDSAEPDAPAEQPEPETPFDHPEIEEIDEGLRHEQDED